jgi:Flp pilus assembly protein TadB
MSIGERWLVGSMIVAGSIVAVAVIIYGIHLWRQRRRHRQVNERLNRLP